MKIKAGFTLGSGSVQKEIDVVEDLYYPSDEDWCNADAEEKRNALLWYLRIHNLVDAFIIA